MNLATLVYGDMTEIADYLDSTEQEVTPYNVQAVLANLCRRVAALERRHAEIDGELAKSGEVLA